MQEHQRLERNANRLTECFEVFAEALNASLMISSRAEPWEPATPKGQALF